MNDLLQETMRERAEGAPRPRVDVDAMMAAGERRRKKRGTAAIGAVAAVCAVTVFGVIQVAGTSGDVGAPDGYSTNGNGEEFQQRRATYAQGSTIHYGNDSVDVGDREIRSFVQTDDGFVFAEQDGTVYLANGASVRKIGSGDAGGHYLKADDSGSYVAWVDSESAKLSEFVVFDTASMTEVVRTSEGNTGDTGSARDSDGPFVFAVDGDGAYVLNGDGLARIDIGSGDTEVLRAGVDDGSEIPDVADGWILRNLNSGGSEAGALPLDTVMSRDPKANRPLTVAGARDLSPDGRYVSTDHNDSEQIVDTRTNEEIVLDTTEYDFQAVSQWIDVDTATVMTLEKPFSDPAVSLQTCELPSGDCSIAAEGLAFDIQLPVGEHLAGD